MNIDNDKIVKISITGSPRIHYVTTTTGEKGTLKIIENRITLLRGRIYYIPIDTEETLDNNNVFKTFGEINEKIDVRNIEKGFAAIVPIIHNVQVKHDMILGYFL